MSELPSFEKTRSPMVSFCRTFASTVSQTRRACLMAVLTVLSVGLAHRSSAAETIRIPGALINLLQEANVAARLEGVVQEVSVQDGDVVKVDQVLAVIDNEEAELAVQKAQLELDIANKQTTDNHDLLRAQEENLVAANNLRRAEESKQKFERSISEADMDRYRLLEKTSAIDVKRYGFNLEVAKLTARLREHELAIARKALERHNIKAPIPGVVVDVKCRVGEWVQPNDPVLRILRIDKLRADGYVNASDVPADMKGRPVTFVVDLPGRPSAEFRGKLVFVSPEVNPVDGKIRIWAEIDNPALRLKPGLKGELRIENDE